MHQKLQPSRLEKPRGLFVPCLYSGGTDGLLAFPACCRGGCRIIRRGYLKWWRASRAAKFLGVPYPHPVKTPPPWGDIPTHRT